MRHPSTHSIKQTLLLLWILFFSGCVAAHDFWIEASNYSGKVGEPTELRLYVGEAYEGSSLPRVEDWFHRFDVTGPASSDARPTDGELGDTPAGRFRFDQNGYYHVAYESKREFVNLKPTKFHDYLIAEGLESVIAKREALGESGIDGREYYSRSAKVLASAGTPEANAGIRVGLPLELIMLSGTDRSAHIRLLFRGAPIAGVRIQAIPKHAPASYREARTDAKGEVRLDLDFEGEWLIKAVHMERAAPEDREKADWESWWASLTLKR